MNEHDPRKRAPVIFENEPEHAEIIKEVLTDSGIGRETVVLSELDETQITPTTSLVILDIGLNESDPETAVGNALALVNALQLDDRRNVPVLVVTAYNISSNQKQKFEEAGAKGVMNKPFEIQELREVVKKLQEENDLT